MSEHTNTHDRNGGHPRPVSIPHLVVGLVFLGVVAIWALAEAGVVEYDGQRWVLPLILVLAGSVGLLVSLVNGVRRSRRRPDQREDTAAAWDDLGLGAAPDTPAGPPDREDTMRLP